MEIYALTVALLFILGTISMIVAAISNGVPDLAWPMFITATTLTIVLLPIFGRVWGWW